MKKNIEITNEEKEALDEYKGINYKYINLFLGNNIENDIEYAELFLNKENPENKLKEDLEKSINIIKKIYSLMVKYSQDKDNDYRRYYRGTSENEINNMIKDNQISKFLSTTGNPEVMKSFAYDNKKPAFLEVKADNTVPFVKIKDVLGYETGGEDEYLFSPFTKIRNIDEKLKYYTTDMEGKQIEIPQYKINIERQEIDKGTIGNKEQVKDEINSKIPEITAFLIELKNNKSISLDLESKWNYNKRKISALANTLNKTEQEKEDLKEFAKETEQIEQELNSIYKRNNELKEDISIWKSNIHNFLKTECYELEEELRIKIEKQKEQDKKRILTDEINNSIEKLLNDKDYMSVSVRKIIEMSSKYNVLSKNIGIGKSNDFEEMRLTVSQIQDLEKNIFKLDNIFQKMENIENLESFDKYLGDITKFERNIDDSFAKYENEIKNNFQEAIYIRIEELKAKVNEDYIRKQINEVKEKNDNPFKKLLNKVTGKEKIYDTKIESLCNIIKIIDNKIINIKDENKNYNIYDNLARIEVFLNDCDNKDDMEEIEELKILKQNLYSIYSDVIDNEKLKETIENKTVQNAMVSMDNFSEIEKIKLEEYLFLHKNGYGEKVSYTVKEKHTDEEMAERISAINRYIEVNLQKGEFNKEINLEDTLELEQ